MATQRKPKVVPPFQGVSPPEDLGAPPVTPPRPQVDEMKPSPELLRKLEEEEKLRVLRDESGKAEEISRRASMGTYKEPVKKAKGGAVSASRRADGIAQRGKTRGKYL